MRTSLLSLLSLASSMLLASACVTDDMAADDTDPAGTDPSTNPPGGTNPPAKVCALTPTVADPGDLLALKANQCNIPGSQGQRKWYRLAAAVSGTTDIVQLELWDNLGAFSGGVVRTGTFTISGADASPLTCGVCVRAIGDKSTAAAQEFFATSGTVEVTQIGGAGQPISAVITNASLVQIDPTTRAVVSSGCTTSLARVKVSGTVVTMGGGGGGGGGGGNCPAGIAD